MCCGSALVAVHFCAVTPCGFVLVELSQNANAKRYLKFYEQYGLNLKEGVAMDQQNGPSLAKLLRCVVRSALAAPLCFLISGFRAAHSYPSSVAKDSEPVSLEAYVNRMKTGQETIYYLVTSSRKVATQSVESMLSIDGRIFAQPP